MTCYYFYLWDEDFGIHQVCAYSPTRPRSGSAIADPETDDGRLADYSSYGRAVFPSALLAAVISSKRNTFPKETCCQLQTPDADRQNLKSNGDASRQAA